MPVEPQPIGQHPAEPSEPERLIQRVHRAHELFVVHPALGRADRAVSLDRGLYRAEQRLELGLFARDALTEGGILLRGENPDPFGDRERALGRAGDLDRIGVGLGTRFRVGFGGRSVGGGGGDIRRVRYLGLRIRGYVGLSLDRITVIGGDVPIELDRDGTPIDRHRSTIVLLP